MTTLSDIFSKKAQRQRMVETIKMNDNHLDPLYEWSLAKFDEESHPFLPLALALTYGRLLSTFLLRGGGEGGSAAPSPKEKSKNKHDSSPAPSDTDKADQKKDERKNETQEEKDSKDGPDLKKHDKPNDDSTAKDEEVLPPEDDDKKDSTGDTQGGMDSVAEKDTKEKDKEGKDQAKDPKDTDEGKGIDNREPAASRAKTKTKESKENGKKTSNTVFSSVFVQPSMIQDPAVNTKDRNGVLMRIAESGEKFPRLQLTSKVSANLDGLVNDLIQVLKTIKDPAEDTLAVTTVFEKARLLLPKNNTKSESDVFGKILVEDGTPEKQKAEEDLFCIFARVTLGWTTEKVRRATEAYHDFSWLCDQTNVLEPAIRSLAWKAAVLYKTVAQNQDKYQTYASRRYALLASCGAVGLWKCSRIAESALDDVAMAAPPNSDTMDLNETTPAAKRPRLATPTNDQAVLESENVVKELVAASGKEAAFTRWIGGTSGRWKIAADLNDGEIRQAILSLANLLLMTIEPEEKKRITLRVADHFVWWQALSESLSKLPETGEWETMAIELYTNILKREDSSKTFSQNIQSFHEFDILDYERKLETAKERPTIHLVDKIVWDSSIMTDPLTSVIVSKGVMGEAALRMEKVVHKAEVERIKSRAFIPTIYDEGMELNEWTVALLSFDSVSPTEGLVEKLEKALPGKQETWTDLLPKIVNKSLLLLLQESMTAKVGRKASVLIDSNGEVSVSGELSHDKAMCRGIVAFFYHALESILSNKAGPSTVDDTFFRAILTCCLTCVVGASGITHKIHPKVEDSAVYSFMQMTESTPMSFLHYAPIFRSSLTANNSSKFPLPLTLPKRVYRDFFLSELSVLDSVLWAKDPNFEDVLPDRVDDMIETTDDKCCWWPVKVLVDENEEGADSILYPSAKEDTYYLEIYHNLSVLMERALEVSHSRMERVCRALQVAHWRLLLKYSWQTFRHLLRKHIKLFYDRHIDHWILTTIYGVGKRMKFEPEISFARTIEAYTSVRAVELGEAQCHRIVRQVKIKTSEGSSQLGHIILLYNKVFIPAMRSFLLKSEDLKEATARLAALKDQESTVNLPSPGITDIPIKEELDVEMS